VMFTMSLIRDALSIKKDRRDCPPVRRWTWRSLRSRAYARKGTYGVRCAQMAMCIATLLLGTAVSAPGRQNLPVPVHDNGPAEEKKKIPLPRGKGEETLWRKVIRPPELSLEVSYLTCDTRNFRCPTSELVKVKPRLDQRFIKLPKALFNLPNKVREQVLSVNPDLAALWLRGKNSQIQSLKLDFKIKSKTIRGWTLKGQPALTNKEVIQFLCREGVPPGDIYISSVRRRVKTFLNDKQLLLYNRYAPLYSKRGFPL